MILNRLGIKNYKDTLAEFKNLVKNSIQHSSKKNEDILDDY